MQHEGGDAREYLKVVKNIVPSRYLKGEEKYWRTADFSQRYMKVGDSDEWFVLLERSGSHYTLYSTQVQFVSFTTSTESDQETFHFQSTGVFGMRNLREVVDVELWGLHGEEVAEEEGEFNSDWHVGARIKTFIFGETHFFLFFLFCLHLFHPRHRVVWRRCNHRLGERKQLDPQRRSDLGRNNGGAAISPHDHLLAFLCISIPP